MKKSPTQEPPMSENEKLREALEQIAASSFGLQGIQEDYGHDTNAYNFHAMKYWFQRHERLRHLAREALSTPPSKADADDVERVAFAMWLDDAERAAPNVAHYRTIETFRKDLSDRDRETWLRQARAALSAIQNRAAGLREAVVAFIRADAEINKRMAIRLRADHGLHAEINARSFDNKERMMTMLADAIERGDHLKGIRNEG